MLLKGEIVVPTPSSLYFDMLPKGHVPPFGPSRPPLSLARHITSQRLMFGMLPKGGIVTPSPSSLYFDMLLKGHIP